MADLVPSYLDFNFDNIKQDLKDKMAQSPVFQDYNQDGSNITILIELVAYLGELSSYYLNKIAQNVYIDTADMTENIIRLGNLVGYYPKGSISSRTTLTVTVPSAGPYYEGGCQLGDTVRANAWKEVFTNQQSLYNGASIYFTSTNDVYHTISEFPFTMTVPVSEGRSIYYTYTGADLIDNTIYLPNLQFGYDDDLTDDIPSVELQVSGITWTRISDFYDNLSGVDTNDNVYVLRVNKYSQYVIMFSDARNVPASNDTIAVNLVQTLGSNGNVAAKTIVSVNSQDFISVSPSAGDEFNLGAKWYSIINPGASIGGGDPETNEQMKVGIQNTVNAQYRCVTKQDYISFLEENDDVKKASAWGEQETTQGGNILDYNKVFLCINPTTWDGNLNYTVNSDGISIASSYTNQFLTVMSNYLELRKMLCAWEEFVKPDFTYLRFNIGLKVKNNYRFANVRQDVFDKLAYYFTLVDRQFGELISYMDIINYIIDPTKTSPTNNFSNTKGIYYMTVRGIDFYDLISTTWISPYDYGNLVFPQYAYYDESTWEEDFVKNIQLGFDQYPLVSIPHCNITEES